MQVPTVSGKAGLIFIALVSAICLMPAAAQSFDELQVRLAEHPAIIALGHDADASRERSVAATALPDPVVSLGINNFPIFDPSFNTFLPTNKAIGISQAFPSRAGREAQSRATRAGAEQIDRIRAAQLSLLSGELIALLHEKAHITQARDLAQARTAKYDDLIQVIEAEIGAGSPSVFRLAQIEAERAGVARELAELQRQDSEADARLVNLIGFVPAATPPPLAALDWPDDALGVHAVRVADAALAITGFGVEGAKAAWKSNWGAQLTYQQRESGANFAGDDWVSGMVTFSVPLWAGRSQAPRLRAAQADRASAQMRYQSAARTAAAQYASQAAIRRAALETRLVLARSIAAVEDEIAAQLTIYESGSGSYAPIIDGEIAILKLRADIAAEDARLAAATARMNALLVQP